MSSLSWLILGFGVVFAVLGLLLLVLQLLIEGSKPATERHWPSAFARFWEEGGKGVSLGPLLIVIVLFLEDPNLWFKILLVPVALTAIVTIVIHLVGSMKAVKEDKPAEERQLWQARSEKAGAIMLWCCYALIGLSLAYSWVNMTSKVEKLDALTEKVKALEEKVDEMSRKNKE